MKSILHSTSPGVLRGASLFGILIAVLAGAGVLRSQQFTPPAAAPVPVQPGALPPAVPGTAGVPETPTITPPGVRLPGTSNFTPAPSANKTVSVLPPPPTPPIPASVGLPPAPLPITNNHLSRAIIDEETNPDLAVAVRDYENLLRDFDQQRATAAQAVFRLGECYRRLGRLEEARAQYARILREFVDQPDLAQQSLRLLAGTPATAPMGMAAGGGGYGPDPFQEDAQSVQDQLASYERQMSMMEQSMKVGAATANDVEPLRREILKLQGRLRVLAKKPATNEATGPFGGGGGVVAHSGAAMATFGRGGATVDPTAEHIAFAIDQEISEAQDKIAESRHLIDTITKTEHPEALPPEILKDPRYLALKDFYENTVTDQSADPKSEDHIKSITNARTRVETWLQQIYIPELQMSATYAEDRLKTLKEKRDRAEAKHSPPLPPGHPAVR